MTLFLRIDSDGVMERFHNQLAALGEKQLQRVLQRGLAHTGNKAKTQVIRALTKQTGLRRAVIVRAVKFRKPSFGKLEYVLKSQGGNIALKYFRPRETRKGVSAAPRGKRQVFPGTFSRAGWFPGRVDKPDWNGQVFRRTGGQLQAIATGEDPDFEMVSNEIVDLGGYYLDRVMVFSADDDDFTYQVQAQAGPEDEWEKPAFHDVTEDVTGYAVEAAPGSLTGWQRILVTE